MGLSKLGECFLGVSTKYLGDGASLGAKRGTLLGEHVAFRFLCLTW